MLWLQQGCFIHTYHVLTLNIRKTILKGWDLIKLIIFPASPKIPLSEKGLSFNSIAQQWRIQSVHCTALIHAKVSRQFPTVLFTTRANVSKVNRHMMSPCYYCEHSFDCPDSLELSQGISRGVLTTFGNYWCSFSVILRWIL